MFVSAVSSPPLVSPLRQLPDVSTWMVSFIVDVDRSMESGRLSAGCFARIKATQRHLVVVWHPRGQVRHSRHTKPRRSSHVGRVPERLHWSHVLPASKAEPSVPDADSLSIGAQTPHHTVHLSSPLDLRPAASRGRRRRFASAIGCCSVR